LTPRLLSPKEWPRLKEIFASEFGTDEMPDPATTEIYAGTEGDEVICFFMRERVVHAGPFYVAPEHRGQGLARRMAEQALEMSRGEEVYVSVTTPEAKHLAESLGLTRIAGTLYCKEKEDVR
jgi:GNAT superfamily N-acetyltransferase